MGLFSTLLLKTTAVQSESSDDTSSATVVAPATLPTVVQLYTSRPVPIVAIDTAAVAMDVLENEKKSSSLKKYHTQNWLLSHHKSFAPLHYSAVQCLPESSLSAPWLADTATATGGLRNQSRLLQEMAHQWIPPDLGVFDCRVDAQGWTDALWPRTLLAGKEAPVYIMVVDMADDDQLAHVEASISILQQALLRFLIQQAADFGTRGATTSLAQLRTVQFGRANGDDKGVSSVAPLVENEANICLNLAICVLWPHSSNEEEEAEEARDYTTQQHVQLLFYHIRKYAAALNATLLFVGEEETAAQHGNQQPTVGLRALPWLWKDLARGVDLVPKTNPAEDTTKEEEEEDKSGFSLIYGPGHHQEELIESVLLRNASYPGHWDAAQDSVWKILPAPRPCVAAAPRIPPGDAVWYKELHDSMAPPAAAVAAHANLQSPAPSSKGGAAPTSAAKTPNDAAVSSFFEGLLK